MAWEDKEDTEVNQHHVWKDSERSAKPVFAWKPRQVLTCGYSPVTWLLPPPISHQAFLGSAAFRRFPMSHLSRPALKQWQHLGVLYSFWPTPSHTRIISHETQTVLLLCRFSTCQMTEKSHSPTISEFSLSETEGIYIKSVFFPMKKWKVCCFHLKLHIHACIYVEWAHLCRTICVHMWVCIQICPHMYMCV